MKQLEQDNIIYKKFDVLGNAIYNMKRRRKSKKISKKSKSFIKEEKETKINDNDVDSE